MPILYHIPAKLQTRYRFGQVFRASICSMEDEFLRSASGVFIIIEGGRAAYGYPSTPLSVGV